jgi:hypothetical protein
LAASTNIPRIVPAPSMIVGVEVLRVANELSNPPKNVSD